jgi:hypothetical protein
MTHPSLDLFVSYSRSDTPFVDNLEHNLNTSGYTTWVDRRKLEGGQHFPQEIEAAIERCRAVLVVLSPRAINSPYVQSEIAYAATQGKPLIPLLLKPCRSVPQLVH